MNVTSIELVKLAGVVKRAQIPPQFIKHRRRRTDPMEGAYPDYSKSLLTQMEVHPNAAGVRRAISSGTLAAILGGLIGRMISDNPAVVGGGALAGGTLGAIPGFMAGKREAESEKSRLLFLRRLGISRPGELEALLNYPDMGKRVTENEVPV